MCSAIATRKKRNGRVAHGSPPLDICWKTRFGKVQMEKGSRVNLQLREQRTSEYDRQKKTNGNHDCRVNDRDPRILFHGDPAMTDNALRLRLEALERQMAELQAARGNGTPAKDWRSTV